MVFELSEIKHIRKKLGLSQTALAKQAGVSQSLIAKIEAGRIDPTYTNAQKILNALQAMSTTQEPKAEDIMNTKIVFVSPAESLKDAIGKMKRFEISQLPVMDKQKIVGLVSEVDLLEALLSKKSRVEEVMEEAPPIISRDAPLSLLVQLLKFCQMLVVNDKGRFVGVITKADILRKAY